MQRYRWHIAAALAVVCVIAAATYAWLPPHAGDTTETQVVVAPGDGARDIAGTLRHEGLIRSTTLFQVYIRIMGMQTQLKAGTYVLTPSMSIPQIADIITGGRGLNDDIEITIPEGLNVWQIDALLVDVRLTTAGVFRTRYHADEGKLFPETYRLKKTDGFEVLVGKMQETFAERASSYTDTQIVIASIIEKEAKTKDDMALVSGVIAHRLALGMPLQVDATVGYGWCLRTAGFTRPCDTTQAPIGTEIKVDGPYNTYTRTGLPVGPISNPGLQALEAAAHPKTSDYLYYLSTRDGSNIIFSQTLDEHLRNRLKYLGF